MALVVIVLTTTNPVLVLAQYPVETSVTVIDFSGVHYPLYPGDAGTVFNEANPFRYEQPVSVKFSQSTFFNKLTQTVTFDVVPEQLSARQIETIQNQVVGLGRYDTTATGAKVTASNVLVVPLSLMDYKIEIKVAGSETEQVDDKPLTAKGPYTGVMRVSHKIVNPKILTQLEQGPAAVTVVFTPYYLFKTVKTRTAYMTKTNSAASSSWEKVFGRAAPDAMYVNREGLQKLQATMIDNVTLSFFGEPGDLPKVLRDTIIDTYKLIIKPANQQSFDALSTMMDSVFLYGKTGFGTEILPTNFHTLTTSWKTSDDVLISFQKAWNNLHDVAVRDTTDEAFFNSIQSHKTNAGSSSDAGDALTEYFAVSGSSDSDFSNVNDFTSLTNVQKSALHDFHESLKTTGSMASSQVQKAYKEWTGEDYKAGTKPKSLDLYLVKSSDFVAAISSMVGIYTSGAAESKPRTISLPLRNSDDFLSETDTLFFENFEDLKDGDLKGQGSWAGDSAIVYTTGNKLGSRDVNGFVRPAGTPIGTFFTLHPIDIASSKYPVVEFKCDNYAVFTGTERSHAMSVGFYDNLASKTLLVGWTVVNAPLAPSDPSGWQFDARYVCNDKNAIQQINFGINVKCTTIITIDTRTQEVFGTLTEEGGRRSETARFPYVPARMALTNVGFRPDFSSIPLYTGFELDNLQVIGKRSP